MFNFIKTLFTREGFGLVRDFEFENDPRNIRYEMIAGDTRMPETEINVERNNITFNQGRTSSCTCQGACGIVADEENVILSPRYAFKKIKTEKQFGSSRLEWGAYMADPFRLKVNYGICEYALAPTTNKSIKSDKAFLDFEITSKMEENAKRYKGGSYFTVAQFGSDGEQFDSIVRYMATENKPLITAVLWNTQWNKYARTTGIIPVKKWTGRNLWHVMKACRYKVINGIEYLGFRNSYGRYYGGDGITWLPRGTTLGLSIGYMNEKINKPSQEDKKKVKRDKRREKANMQELNAMVEVKFPLDVNPEANKKARQYFERNKLVFNWGVCYNGWTFIDVINHIYAVSRDMKLAPAYKLDFLMNRQKFMKKYVKKIQDK